MKKVIVIVLALVVGGSVLLQLVLDSDASTMASGSSPGTAGALPSGNAGEEVTQTRAASAETDLASEELMTGFVESAEANLDHARRHVVTPGMEWIEPPEGYTLMRAHESPDGRYVAYIAYIKGSIPTPRHTIMIQDTRTGQWTEVPSVVPFQEAYDSSVV